MRRLPSSHNYVPSLRITEQLTSVWLGHVSVLRMWILKSRIQIIALKITNDLQLKWTGPKNLYISLCNELGRLVLGNARA